MNLIALPGLVCGPKVKCQRGCGRSFGCKSDRIWDRSENAHYKVKFQRQLSKGRCAQKLVDVKFVDQSTELLDEKQCLHTIGNVFLLYSGRLIRLSG